MPEVIALRITELYYESGLTPSIIYASKYPQEIMLRKLKNTNVTAIHTNIITSFLKEFTQNILSEHQRILERLLQETPQNPSRTIGKITAVLDDLFGRVIASYPVYFRKKLEKLN